MSAPDATRPVGAGSVLCGRYRLIRLIAQGGMAAVWEAHDSVLSRSVAVKMLHPHLAADHVFLERFRREAVSAARLSHPNVVATFDAGITPEGTAFIVMELIRGRTLSVFEGEHRPVPGPICIAVAKQIADALAHAHAAGLVHRDVKPANVMVCDTGPDGPPLVKVTDFGIAKAAEGLELELTKTGVVLGTPKYLSPEQIAGHEPDARADIYALGLVLFELITGTAPFRGPTEMAVAVQHLNETPPHLRELRANVPPALDALVAQMLEKRPDDRPPTAVVVRRALVAIEAQGRGGRAAGAAVTPTVAHEALTADLCGDGGGSPGGFPSPGPEAAAGPRLFPTDVTPAASASRPAVGEPAAGPGPGAGAGPGDDAAAVMGRGPWVDGGQGLAVREAGAVPRVAPGGRTTPQWPVAENPPRRPRNPAEYDPSSRRLGPPAPVPPGDPGGPPHERPARAPKPNWAGRLVALLVIAALIVVLIVASDHGSGHSPRSSPPTNAGTTPIAIQSVSVFHLERDADHASEAGNVIDGNPDTAWETDHYLNASFAGLRHGLGLAFTLGSSQALHQLRVTSSTQGWSAEVFVADAISDPPALAPWGPAVASQQGIAGSTVFNLGGHQGRTILLWITYLGSADQTAIAEVTVD